MAAGPSIVETDLAGAGRITDPTGKNYFSPRTKKFAKYPISPLRYRRCGRVPRAPLLFPEWGTVAGLLQLHHAGPQVWVV